MKKTFLALLIVRDGPPDSTPMMNFNWFSAQPSRPSQPPPAALVATPPPTVIASPAAIVHLTYELGSLGPPPSGWTRFVCVSDTHTRSYPVPPGDVLLHSGDLTNAGTYREFEKTMTWLYGLPHKVKIVIAGNHDLSLHTGWYDENYSRWNREKQDVSSIMELLRGPKAVQAGIVYLQDECYEFQAKEGCRRWTVYGSPWSPYFFNWAFNYRRGREADKLVSKFPKTDILLTHGPPFGILDETRGGSKAGCSSLNTYLPSLRPRLHAFGHIHEAHGVEIRAWLPDFPHEPRRHPQDVPGQADADEYGDLDEDALQSYGGNENPMLLQGTLPSAEAPEDLARTVFANAANFLSGSRFGGGFQPVVVDLRDDA